VHCIGRYVERLEAGLFTLQRICIIMACLVGPAGRELHTDARLRQHMRLADLSFGDVLGVLNEYAATIGGDADRAAEAEAERARAGVLVEYVAAAAKEQ